MKSLTIILLGLLTITSSQLATADDVKMVPLVTTLPRPQFYVGPLHFDPRSIPDLETNWSNRKPRPTFFVPKGTSNLAFRKPITSSDSWPVMGELAMVTDGDKQAIEGSYVEIGKGKQWVQIDLGTEANVYAVILWLFAMPGGLVCNDVVVQVSNDVQMQRNTKTIYNNDRNNSSGFGLGKDYAYAEQNDGKLIDAKGVAGRYVRVNTNGNSSGDRNVFVEVEVWGKPEEKK